MSRVTEGWSFENRSERRERDSDEIRDGNILQVLMLKGKENRFRAESLIRAMDPQAERVGGSELRQLTSILNPMKAMGFDTLYLTGIFPKGSTRAKGISTPFCITNHIGIDPAWGTIDDLKFLIQEAHSRKPPIRIIVDLVFNHTSWDHPWVKQHPDYYIRTREPHPRILPGGFTDSNRGGATHALNDVAQLDLSRQDVRDELCAIVEELVGWGIDGFRVDMAAQTMNRQFDPRYGMLKQRAMHGQEFWSVIIDAAHRRNKKVSFFGETHGEEPARALYEAGFDVVTSKTKDVAEEDEGWHDAHASRDSRRISRAVEARCRMKKSDTAAGVGFASNHDTPSLEKTMGGWAEGAIAMSVFMPPFLWVAGAEGGFDFPDSQRSGLDDLEIPKQFPLDPDYEIDYQYDADKLTRRQNIFREKARVFRELGGRVTNVPLVDYKREGWVGFEVRSAVRSNASAYIIIGNPNTWPVESDFGQIPPCEVWLLKKGTPQKKVLAKP